ncbi:hypothetical protein A9P82_08630 [Arachidicoccus ginsenosidimutans]|nr:hypothetical protein A9P82_08630 [Arachidicoccus sp. BS20]
MILVTGASGLVGSHILQELKSSNAHIIAVCRNIPENADERFEWESCDILDVIALENLFHGVDKIYHCAAVVSFDPKKKKELFQINVEGTANVVNAALNCGVKKLLHVSSVAAIGESKGEDKVVQEDLEWKDECATDYGKSKHLAEMEVWRGLSEGLNAVIINPTIILGCADWNSGSTEIFKTVYEEFPYYTEGVHGFVDAQDVARAAVMLMNSDVQAQRFILNGANISYKDLFLKIANAFDKKPPHKKVTKLLAEIVWRVSYFKGKITGKPSILNKNSARIALANIQFDNRKLFKYFPDFQYTAVDVSVERICKALKGVYHLE